MKEYFRKKSVREILEPILIENGIDWYKYLQNSNDVLDYLQEKGELMISNDYLIKDVDEFDGLLMISENKEIIPEGYSSLRFIKRGNEIKIPRIGSRSAVINGRVSLENLINGTLDNIKEGDYSGYSIKGIRRDRIRKVRLIDCIKGSELFVLGDIEVKPYFGNNPDYYGLKCNVKVPSKSEDKFYSFMMENISIRKKRSRNKEYLASIFDFSTTHDCEAKGWNGLHYRRVVGEEYSCLHEVAAYFAVQDFINRETHYEVPLNPFLFPSDEMWDFSRKLRKKTLKQFWKDGKLRRRTLNEVMLEILLWKKLEKDGVFKCFKKRGDWQERIKDY